MLALSLGKCCVKFSEIANRLTGISTPLVGVSWQPTDLEVSAARRRYTEPGPDVFGAR